jgi:hypothetical protein
MDERWKPHATLPGVAERFIDGGANDTQFYRQKVQDVAPIINAASRIRNETNGATPEGGRHVGRIPATVYYDWIEEWALQGKVGPGNMSGLNDLLLGRLRDRDYAKFRTTDGGI